MKSEQKQKPKEIKLHAVEEVYEKYISRDYDLLYEYVQKEKPIMCFMDECKYSRWHRVMEFTVSTGKFSSTWLWSHNVSKERYIDFCKNNNLSFVKPK